MLDISKDFDTVFEAGLHQKLWFYGTSGRISVFLILYEKSLYECTVDSDVPQGYIRGPTVLLLHVNDLPDDDISDIAIYLCWWYCTLP